MKKFNSPRITAHYRRTLDQRIVLYNAAEGEGTGDIRPYRIMPGSPRHGALRNVMVLAGRMVTSFPEPDLWMEFDRAELVSVLEWVR